MDAELESANARCSLWWSNAPRLPGERVGVIGHYRAEESGGTEILEGACARLRDAGCTLAVGPMDGDTWRRYRLVTWRGSAPPFFLEPDNPDEWPEHFRQAGFGPLATYTSALNPNLDAVDPRLERVESRMRDNGIVIRALRPEKFEEELRHIFNVSIGSFQNNYLYTPISEEDFFALYRPIEKHIRPELVLLAFDGDEPIGFIFGIPDLAEAQRGQPVETVILKTVAVLPGRQSAGLGGLLVARAQIEARKLGFHRAIHALMHQANNSRNISGPLRGNDAALHALRALAAMNLAAILAEQAKKRPEAVAIYSASRGRERSITFAELERAAARAAGMLRASGLTPGDRVLVFQPMSIELYVALLAIFRLGLVGMFLDPSAGRAHIERCCELAPPAAFIGSGRAQWLRLMLPLLRRIRRNFGARRLTNPTGPTGPTDGDAFSEIDPPAPALLTFTSGSTGEPKAAVRTHGFLIAQHRVLERGIALVPGEVDLATLPIFGLANLASGVTTVIPDADLRRPGEIDAKPVVEQMLRRHVTRAAASPAFFEQIADFCERRSCVFDALEKIYTGGAPVFPRLLTRLQTIAPRAEVVAVYGSTEAEPIAHVSHGEMTADDFDATARGGGLLAGRPVPEIQVRIMADRWGTPLGPFTAGEFEALALSANGIGEIVVSGAHVLGGYLGGRGDAETKFRVDGGVWHRTGDAGYFDAAGRLWLAGRCAAKIADGPGFLYPFAVECVAQQFEFVRRCAFIAVGRRRVLAVEFSGNRGAADMERLRAALAWARVNEIKPLRRIPVDGRHNAKIDYGKLRRELE